MGELGRDRILVERGVKALEKIASAMGSFVEMAESNDESAVVESGPPVCPHCGKLNPEVTQLGGGGSGPLGEYQFKAETHCCNKIVYCAPVALFVAAEAIELEGGNGTH